MNTPLNNLVIYNGYPLSIVVALVIQYDFSDAALSAVGIEAQSLELVQPTVIKALLSTRTRNSGISSLGSSGVLSG